MLFKSALLTQASGSLNGVTWSHNRGGMYTRARVLPVNPGTPAQVAARAAFADLSVRWSQDLTQGERDAWNLYAFNVPLVGPLGEPRNVGGLGMFIRSNVPRLIAGYTRIDAAPTNFTLGLTSTFNVVASEATQDYVITLPAVPPAAVEYIQIALGRPQTPGVLFYRGPWRVAASPAPAAFPFTQAAVDAIAVGQRVFLKARTLMADGRLGPATYASVIVTA